MPLRTGSSQKTISSNIRTLSHEIGSSPHVQSHEQAVAIAMNKAREERKHKQGGGPAVPVRQLPPANPQMPYGQFGPSPNMFSPVPLARQTAPARPAPPIRLPPTGGPRSARDLTEKLRMFYDHIHELRPDQQQRLLRMMGQDPDKPFAAKPELNWDELQQKHDVPESTHERFLYYPPYRKAEYGGTVDKAMQVAHKLATGGDAIALPLMSAPGTPGVVPFKGPINSHIPGRTDKLRLDVAPGSYVIPADVTSIAGEGNTLAGQHLIDAMVPEPHVHARHLQPPRLPGGFPQMRQHPIHLRPVKGAPALQHADGGEVQQVGDIVQGPWHQGMRDWRINRNPDLGLNYRQQLNPESGEYERAPPADVVPLRPNEGSARGGTHEASPGNVPIVAAGGEHILSPHAIVNTFGDLDYGHKVLDQYVLQMRDREIKRLKNAPPPKKAEGGAVA